jgi:hypothetical protein
MRMRMGMGMGAWVQGDSASPVRGACSRGMLFTPKKDTLQRYPTHPAGATAAARRSSKTSPADPVSRGTLPTAPAPTTRRCERRTLFHGRTAARRQMGKWAR